MPSVRPSTSSSPDDLYDARYFDEELHRDHWFRNNAAKRARRWAAILHMLELRRDDVVLDLGCAVGTHTLQLAPLCREVVGVDLAEAAIQRARARARAAGIPNVRFLRADASCMPELEDASVDRIAAIDFIEHVDDATLGRVLGECRRLLRNKGRLAIFTPCRTHYVERLKAHNLVLQQLPGHVAVRTPEACVASVRRAGFAVVSLSYVPSTFPVAGYLDRWLWNVPAVGPWFRFRICLACVPAAGAG